MPADKAFQIAEPRHGSKVGSRAAARQGRVVLSAFSSPGVTRPEGRRRQPVIEIVAEFLL